MQVKQVLFIVCCNLQLVQQQACYRLAVVWGCMMHSMDMPFGCWRNLCCCMFSCLLGLAL